MTRHASLLLISVILLFAMGLLMVFNTTSAEVLDRVLSLNTHHALIKQLTYAAVGLCLSILISFFPYQDFIKLSPVFYFFFIFMLILVFIPGVGQEINGARRWLGFRNYSFQPSEFMKVFIPAFYLYYLKKHRWHLTFKSFLSLLAFLIVPLFLILLEPDNGTAGIILVSYVVLFFLSRIKWQYWALPLMLLTITGVSIGSQMAHVHDRIRVYLHPEQDLLGKGHQPYQAKIAAGSGKLFGRGVGESLQKLNYLPEARSDYIAAIYAEEFGFLGMLFLILLYMSVGYFGFRIASCAIDREGFYLAAILTFLVCFQGFINLGVVSGLLPSKGTNLPFFSQGGSSLLANMFALSLILNVARQRIRRVAI